MEGVRLETQISCTQGAASIWMCRSWETKVFVENKLDATHYSKYFTYIVSMISHHTLQDRCYKKTEGQRG